MKRRELESQSYWPGYVDALTNLVLKLLFMVGVFAVGLFAVSMEQALHPQSNDKNQVVSLTQSQKVAYAKITSVLPNAKNVHPPERVADRPKIPSLLITETTNTVVSQTKETSDVILERQIVRSEQILILSFPEAQFIVPDEIKNKLASMVTALGSAKQWHISTSIYTSHGEDRRAGYVRLMATRSALIACGISQKDIELRLLPASDTANDGISRVTIALDRDN